MSLQALTVPERILDELVADGDAAAPVEACGILTGIDGNVERYHALTNADNSAEHFSMVPEEQFAVAKAARAEGHELLAIFHSHAHTPARPSDEDIRLALMPGIVHAILSLAGPSPVLKGFAIDGGVVTEVPVQIAVFEENV
jgi:[CysO sulfur-carrier protein]-S-L-cysteine hydrolase